MPEIAATDRNFYADLKRIESIDFVRGLVMIVMALDHTRDFMHISSLTQDPLNLATTTPFLFFTRWVTHFCAPVFVFLSGTSAYLSVRKRANLVKSRNFLITRGIWLVIMEFTVVNFALWFDLNFRIILFQVIAAIGISFIILSFLIKLRPVIIGITGLVIIFGHNLVSLIPFGDGSIIKLILSPLFDFNLYQISPHFTFVIAYPLIPWLGIMLAGFAAGRLLELPDKRRKKILLIIASSALLVFVFLRLSNFYGDQAPWSIQKNIILTILSFVNVSKYPPSLLFTLMTLGVMFLVLSIFDGVKNRSTEIIKVFGRVPFFYYLIHLYLIHLLMLLIMFLQGYHWSDLSFEPFQFGRAGAGSGIGLTAVYLVWLSLITLLYPLCKWYSDYKLAHKGKYFLRYL
jgi:uncharacterized membrane protein